MGHSADKLFNVKTDESLPQKKRAIFNAAETAIPVDVLIDRSKAYPTIADEVQDFKLPDNSSFRIIDFRTNKKQGKIKHWLGHITMIDVVLLGLTTLVFQAIDWGFSELERWVANATYPAVKAMILVGMYLRKPLKNFVGFFIKGLSKTSQQEKLKARMEEAREERAEARTA